MAADQRIPVPDRRNDVLNALKAEAAALTINDLARRLAMHPNTVRFHLDKLLAAHRVELAPAGRSRPGRPPQRFRAVPGMDPTGPRSYRLLAEILLRELAGTTDAAVRAESAGRVWGSQRPGDEADDDDTVDRLMRLLGDLGFAPKAAESPEIVLTHCPFLDLVQIGPGLVCQVHLGLMRGALTAWASDLTVASLAPFVAPDRCAAYLVPAGTAA